MGYQVYEDFTAPRWAGYGVPAECDWPDCHKKIDRGLAFRCDEHVSYEQPEDADDIEHVVEGCGLFFCEQHLYETEKHDGIDPKPDSVEWVRHMLTDDSWQRWRDENPQQLPAMQARVKEARVGS